MRFYEYESKALFAEGFYGVSDRLDLGVQIPYFDQTFSDQTRSEPVSDAGLSDIRIFANGRSIQLMMRGLSDTNMTVRREAWSSLKQVTGLSHPMDYDEWDAWWSIQGSRRFPISKPKKNTAATPPGAAPLKKDKTGPNAPRINPVDTKAPARNTTANGSNGRRTSTRLD